MLAVEEATRRRIGRELHDDVLQSLLAAHRAIGRAQSGDTGALAQAGDGIDMAVDGVRRLVFDLHPPAFDHTGLPEAIRQIAAQQAELGGWTAELDVDELEDFPHREILLSLARELLTNAAKHSGAAHVSLLLRRARDGLVLDVSDDGAGFGPERLERAVKDGHIGLMASRERVEALGGRFELRTAPGAGTRVSIRLPVRRRGDRGARARAAGRPPRPATR
jgi:two-component system, NarL family, sensor kinase